MLQASSIIRDARRNAGLTQSSLASRLGVPQSVIARLETPGSNPKWETVMRALDACHRDLRVVDKPAKSSIDETLVAARLRMPAGVRIDRFQSSYASMREIAHASARSRGQLA